MRRVSYTMKHETTASKTSDSGPFSGCVLAARSQSRGLKYSRFIRSLRISSRCRRYALASLDERQWAFNTTQFRKRPKGMEVWVDMTFTSEVCAKVCVPCETICPGSFSKPNQLVLVPKLNQSNPQPRASG